MNKLMITAACAFAVGILSAQDMSAPSAAEQSGGGDDGAKAVAVAEASAKELNATPSSDFRPAMQIVEDRVNNLKKKLRKEKKLKRVRIQTGTAFWRFEDPNRDDNKFTEIRGMKAVEAYLAAKAKVIESIKRDVNASLGTKGSENDVDDPIAKANEERREELDAKRRELANKLAELDQATADSINSEKISAKFGNVLDALAKKLDKDFDSKKVPAEKKAVVKQLKAECKAMQKEFAALEKEAKRLAPKVDRTTEMKIDANAEMALQGATVIAQAESWNQQTKEYQMSIAILWSEELAKEATAIVGGTSKARKPGNYSVDDWVDRQNLEVMIGPRSFTDDEGHKIFVGIAAADLECSDNKKALRMRAANLEAQAAVAVTLGSEAKSLTGLERTLTEYDAGLEAKAGIAKMAQDLIKDASRQVLKGCEELRSLEFVHPISRRKTYVCVYYIDPEESNEAMDIIKQSYANAILQDAANKRDDGIHAGAKEALNEQKASNADFERGRAEGKRDVKARVQKAKLQSIGAQGGTTKSGGSAKGGSYSGDSDIDTDF